MATDLNWLRKIFGGKGDETSETRQPTGLDDTTLAKYKADGDMLSRLGLNSAQLRSEDDVRDVLLTLLLNREAQAKEFRYAISAVDKSRMVVAIPADLGARAELLATRLDHFHSKEPEQSWRQYGHIGFQELYLSSDSNKAHSFMVPMAERIDSIEHGGSGRSYSDANEDDLNEVIRSQKGRASFYTWTEISGRNDPTDALTEAFTAFLQPSQANDGTILFFGLVGASASSAQMTLEGIANNLPSLGKETFLVVPELKPVTAAQFDAWVTNDPSGAHARFKDAVWRDSVIGQFEQADAMAGLSMRELYEALKNHILNNNQAVSTTSTVKVTS